MQVSTHVKKALANLGYVEICDYGVEASDSPNNEFSVISELSATAEQTPCTGKIIGGISDFAPPKEKDAIKEKIVALSISLDIHKNGVLYLMELVLSFTIIIFH